MKNIDNIAWIFVIVEFFDIITKNSFKLDLKGSFLLHVNVSK